MTVIDSVLRVGACVRHAAFDTGALPAAAGALLRKVVRHIAHYPIRTRRTFCGSGAHADPASEWCCVMAALGGVVVVRSRRGIRRLHALEFFQGMMATALKKDELIVAAESPLLADDTRTGFEEVSRRKGDFAIAMAVVSYRLDRGVMVKPRLAIGGVEPLPRRVTGAEDAPRGRAPSADVFAEAAKAVAATTEPMEDINNSAAYRRGLVRTLVQRALEGAR
jgi:aerobic carbon-monoxide dehydrogenase medium subunit